MRLKIFVLVTLLLAGSFMLSQNNSLNDYQIEQTSDHDDSTNLQEDTSNTGKNFDNLKIADFSDNQLKEIYNSLNFPNTSPILEPPSITGNQTIDNTINEIASERGYQLREVPNTDLVEYKGHHLQAEALTDWEKLEAQAAKEGIDIKIRSAFRSVEEQRELFLERFNRYGINLQNITSASSRQTINQILATVAPPGYSRHHNGYTLDLYSPEHPVFAYTDAYQWLINNNYENTKKFGFIPSYPQGATNQGPNPEAWEYVWTDKTNLLR